MALQGAAVGASAALGCGTIGLAVYSNIASYLAQRERPAEEEAPDCSMQIIATVGSVSRQVFGAPGLVRAAYTDPVEELRKATAGNEKFASAEFSVAGQALESGYACFNGEVIRAGPSFELCSPIVALGGAKVQRDGKTVTVLPKQTPSLLIQLPSEAEAENWDKWLQTATKKENPIQRLHDVLTEAHDLEKHLSDMHNQMKRHKTKAPHHGHGHHGEPSPAASTPVSPAAGDAAARPEVPGMPEMIEEMKQQLMLKESVEAALQQKISYMELQLRQKDQEIDYFKAQLEVARANLKTAEGPSADQLKRTEEALVQERGNAVAQAKALAELQVQFKRLQDQPSQHEAISRAQQEELMQLRGELRRLEEERNSARMSLANQALQLSASSEEQEHLRQALLAAQAEISCHKELLESRQRELLEAKRNAPTPRDHSEAQSTPTSKLSHSELQVLRTHMQSAVRRALEGAEQGAPEYQQKLQELDDKLVELSPTRWRSGEGSGYVLVGMERPSELSPREISPRPGTLSVSQVYATPTLPSAFGMDLNQDSGEVSRPRRRPSPVEVAPPVRMALSAEPTPAVSLPTTSSQPGSVNLPLPVTSLQTVTRPSGTVNLSASYRSVAPSVAPTALGPIVQPMRSMEVLPAAQMAANAMAASGSSWGAPNWLDARPAAFRSTQTREQFR